MSGSYVVTGGGTGIGKAVSERLLAGGAAAVVVIDRDTAALDRAVGDLAVRGAQARRGAGSGGDRPRLVAVAGDAADEEVAGRAADLAQDAAPLAGWVNNAAVFADAAPFHDLPVRALVDRIAVNLALAVVGCGTAVRRFLAQGSAGAIVNVSSHQAVRAVPGCTPYVTAKAGIEGLTRALAVEYGRRGIRVNAVAPGSIATERYAEFLASQDAEAAARIEGEMARIHPIGRVGRSDEVAATITHLLSDEASFVNGATVPVDGGRTVLAQDPESL